ncbi:hypothetical protein TNCV_918351 [Trichonephila clavipes]|nr:hypothetical protein TNCV_918351 [Trichonephila clavipes]
MVPEILTFEQQEACKNVSTVILNTTENDSNLLKKITMHDVSCVMFFFYLRPLNGGQIYRLEETIFIDIQENANLQMKIQSNDYCFFDIHGNIYPHWVPADQTIHQYCYLHVFSELCERIRKKRLELWKDTFWSFHKDNASTYFTLPVKRFLFKYSIPV